MLGGYRDPDGSLDNDPLAALIVLEHAMEAAAVRRDRDSLCYLDYAIERAQRISRKERS